MMRATLVALLVGPAAAGLGSECMKGLQQLQGGSDVELMMRCRSAFGPEACKQAKQHLGAQPWTQARMEESCQQFAAAYTGMDARTLEAAVATKSEAAVATKSTSVDSTTSTKTIAPTVNVPQATPKPQEANGPIAGLLAKLKAKKQEAEAKAKEAQQATSASKEAKGPLAGFMNKMKEAKNAHEAQANQAKTKVADASKKASGPLAGLMNKMKEAKAAHETAAKIKASEVEEDQKGPLADMFKKLQEGKKAPVLKLYEEAKVKGATQMPSALGAFAGAACLAAVTLLVASRRAAHGAVVTHEQLSEQLDVEQEAE